MDDVLGDIFRQKSLDNYRSKRLKICHNVRSDFEKVQRSFHAIIFIIAQVIPMARYSERPSLFMLLYFNQKNQW